MHSAHTANRQTAYLLLRLTLGLNIAMHGITRIIAGPSTFADALVRQFAPTPLPSWSVHLFALCLPWAETAVGLCLLLGIASRWALILGALEIAALTFGTTLRQDWESAGLQLTYAVVFAILLATHEYNTWSVDRRLWPASDSSTAPHLPPRPDA